MHKHMFVRVFPVGAPASCLVAQHLAFLLRVHTLTKAGNSITSICVVGSALNHRNDMNMSGDKNRGAQCCFGTVCMDLIRVRMPIL
jgi:hypothetical protein